MKNLKVSRKLSIAFSTILLIVIVFCAVAFTSLQRIQIATAANQQTQNILKLSGQILSTLVEHQNAMRGYVASSNAEFIDRMAKYSSGVPPLVAELEQLLGQTKTAVVIPALREAVATFNDQVASTVAGTQDPSKLEAIRREIAKTARLTQVRMVLGDLNEAEIQQADVRNAQLEAAFQTGMLTLVVGGTLTAIAAIVMGFSLTRGLAVPIVGMTGAMRRLADGDTSIAVAGIGRGDELGTMAAAVEVFRQNAVANTRLEQEASHQRTVSETEKTKRAEEDRKRAEAMAQATTSLAGGLAQLAQGNLSIQLETEFAPEFEQFRSDFNKAVLQLSETLVAVSQSTDAIDDGSREISESTNDLSKRTEQQAASLEETAAALDEITVNVGNASNRVEEARTAAADAARSAENSGQVVANAVDAMGRIEQSSNEIAKIIGVIDEIAFQTNLLALNAGVEAARAGEAGKGFAVVAQEVRELAQRSAQAAREIKNLIRISTDEVSTGVKLVSETGTALKTIERFITTVNTQMNAIATSAREQSVGLAEVNTAVNHMDQVTQQNTAMVEETSAASASLAMESAKLRELVRRFDLGQQRPVATLSRQSSHGTVRRYG
ncbi:methyl-accepting chemotaxis sensory transducer [Rhizobium sp. PDO1-076]|uniref:methyl-accepting chemotaxis protein n=1 Tax=Rhizobium sp. PDO1-076 TaxID=1125979 RepID=UPI00024E2B26|nr:methyl-accepting chemotaxis protein [Rhizobium sp. PDO1-076]EHS51731.1 methyl-accepting chemotaxis sensory transducer [Rhizobium sp. PDO1-076]